MPELPEVHTIVNELRAKIKNRIIVNLWWDDSYFLNGISPQYFKKSLLKAKVRDVQRFGKFLFFSLNNGAHLWAHLKMTGVFLYGKFSIRSKKVFRVLDGRAVEMPGDFRIHLIFTLDNGWTLAFSDVRKFARLGIVHDVGELRMRKRIGPDALDIDYQNFVQNILKRKAAIKKVLLNQSVVAGIGNIYADEILWHAKIHPLRSARSLNDRELSVLFRSMRIILKRGIRFRGSTLRNYRDINGGSGLYMRHRFVYDREGEPCQRCAHRIRRIKINQRSSYFCPRCQSL